MNVYQHNNYITYWWRSIDQKIIAAIFLLFGFSMMLVTTSGPAIASRIGLDEHHFVARQAIYLLTAAVTIITLSLLNKKWLKRTAIIGFLVSIILLILVKFYGYQTKGSMRWLNIGSFSLQPSEFIKPFFAVITGWLLSLKFDQDFPSFSICFLAYLVIAFLLVIQPDFGMFVMITAVFSLQLFVAGMPLFWIMLILVSSGIGVMAGYFFLPHVAQRINSFLDPQISENYQISKSILAFQQGGMYGRGPGEGAVKQVIPDSHSDFIFAVAGEEFGAMICLIIIGIFAFIVLRSLLKLVDEEDKFTQLAAIGITSQFGLQSIINIGVTLNLLPTKGMTLPFISYGGSSTIAISMAMGILLGLTRQRASLTRRYQFQKIDL